mmetsp:Transcript_4874/g.5935  ORF Transcript_4874/g.5935 Transcript_4874/m.5935 type:complete len:91 (+) Transcript_4874:1247-1519(+)
MIACDVCEEWFHAHCFGINLAEIVDIVSFPFMCHECKAKTKAKSGKSQCRGAAKANKARTSTESSASEKSNKKGEGSNMLIMIDTTKTAN